MTSFPHLAQKLFNTPLAVLPGKAEIVVAALAERLGITALYRADGTMIAFEGDDFSAVDDEPAEYKGYEIVSRVAIVPIQGTLVQKLGTLRPYSGMTGYDGIRQNFLTATADEGVDAIVLDIDSPGGEVAGCFDLMDTIAAARGNKPIWAILGECAYSAAYALASAADRITVPRTGGTGSVGVIYMHVDLSKALDSSGIKVTLITDGDFKADANEYEELSQRAYDRLKADVTAVGDLFRGSVARYRQLSPGAVKATQAGTFLGAAGVDIGFADAVMAPDAAFRALLKELG
jgi:signal peptide peptidase SppA